MLIMSDSFLEALAVPKPIPGGGGAAAHGACVGLALLEKIVLVELRRQQTTSESPWLSLLEEVKKSSATIRQLRDEDGIAYMRLAKTKTFGSSDAETLTALREATESPIKIMEEAKTALELAARAGKHCKGHLLSDLLVVCELLRAAIDGGGHIAEANLDMMKDPFLRSHYQKKLNQVQSESGEQFRSVEEDILARAKIGKKM